MEFILLLPQVKYVAKIKALPLEHSTTYSNTPSPIHTLHYTQTKAGLWFAVWKSEWTAGSHLRFMQHT